MSREPSVTSVDSRILIVTPVHNEASHIGRLVDSMARQTRPPDRWLVIDDGSTDATMTILEDLQCSMPFLSIMQSSVADPADIDRLTAAMEIRAFNEALANLSDLDGYTYIGKVDGDVELPDDYFQSMLETFASDPALGIVGGMIVEPVGKTGSWRIVGAPDYHVHGALKLYSRACWDTIGGLEERLGWDTIDQTYARMRGFRTMSIPSVVVRHHRVSGSVGGRLRGAMRHGRCSYIARYSLPWILMRATKTGITWRPYGLSGMAFVWGYLGCMLRNGERVEDEEFKRFVRREHRQRIRRALTHDGQVG